MSSATETVTFVSLRDIRSGKSRNRESPVAPMLWRDKSGKLKSPPRHGGTEESQGKGGMATKDHNEPGTAEPQTEKPHPQDMPRTGINTGFEHKQTEETEMGNFDREIQRLLTSSATKVEWCGAPAA